MQVLILTTVYGPGRPHAGLAESISDAMAEQGHSVRIACIDWDAKPDAPTRHFVQPNGVEVVMCAPAALAVGTKIGRHLGKWLMSARRAVPPVDAAFGDRNYDLLLVMTPVVALGALTAWAMRRSRRSIAYVTDFFPVQHVNAGILPRWLGPVANYAETRYLRRFDVISTMSPRGVQFLRERFSLSGKRIETLYLWADRKHATTPPRDQVRAQHDLSLTRCIAVFGGQITYGRGVEDLLAAARRAREAKLELDFLFVGDGPLRSVVENAAADAEANIIWRRSMDRDAYGDLITACDIGLIATIQAHETPVFPSKTLDYLKAGLPIVASVEDASDYRDFVSEQGFGIAVPAGDPAKLYEALQRLAGDRDLRLAMSKAGAQTFVTYFSATTAAKKIMERVDPNAIV